MGQWCWRLGSAGGRVDFPLQITLLPGRFSSVQYTDFDGAPCSCERTDVRPIKLGDPVRVVAHPTSDWLVGGACGQVVEMSTHITEHGPCVMTNGQHDSNNRTPSYAPFRDIRLVTS